VSQTITNNEGEIVEVIDTSDLNTVLWKAVAFLVLVGLPFVVSTAVAVTNTNRDVAELQRDLPDQKSLRRTMDSLLVELRATRREFSQWQGAQRP
jgi:hypothetical protein